MEEIQEIEKLFSKLVSGKRFQRATAGHATLNIIDKRTLGFDEPFLLEITSVGIINDENNQSFWAED